jgi:hypothetical protein
MLSRNISNNIELNQIIHKRIPPYLWDIIGYFGGLIAIFYYDKNGIIIYSCSFVFYGLLNILFDVCSVSFDYSNSIMPNYNNIKPLYNFYISNKKYILQNINTSNPFDEINMIDNSKLKIELTIYVGENKFIKKILFVIYLLGITKKNYTIEDYNNFKNNTIYFV